MYYYEYNSELYRVILLIDKYKQTHDAKIEVYIHNVLVAENKKVGHLYKTRDWIKSNKVTAQIVLDDVKRQKNNVIIFGDQFFFNNPIE